MNFTENISLQQYVDSANKQFIENESRLSEIEGSFETRMNGKTMGAMVGAMIGTVVWLAIFVVFFYFVHGQVHNTLFLVSLIASLALISALLIDEIISFSYYRKILSYKNDISELKNCISVGKSSIRLNLETFIKSRANGWQHPLSVGTSISEEATSIENTMNNIESLKGGFINGLKNFLFYTVVIAITVVGSLRLFGIAGEIMISFSDKFIDTYTLVALSIVGLIIAGIGEILLAKLVWSKTNCAVTNTTLIIIALGPIAFLLVIAAGTLLVMLINGLISIFLSILAILIVGAGLFASASGG